jgi:hypothetical protein
VRDWVALRLRRQAAPPEASYKVPFLKIEDSLKKRPMRKRKTKSRTKEFALTRMIACCQHQGLAYVLKRNYYTPLEVGHVKTTVHSKEGATLGISST